MNGKCVLSAFQLQMNGQPNNNEQDNDTDGNHY